MNREQWIAEAPDRIWADVVMGIWLGSDQPDRKSPVVEYVRADRVAPAPQAPEPVAILRDALTVAIERLEARGHRFGAEQARIALSAASESGARTAAQIGMSQTELARESAMASWMTATSITMSAKACAEFVKWALSTYSWHGEDVDGGSIQDKAQSLGLIVETKYDPAIHGGDPDALPGDSYFLLADDVKQMIAAPELARSAATSVPAGYVLVPVVPTASMIAEGCSNNPTTWINGTPSGFAADVANDVYVSMVRAAPTTSPEPDAVRDLMAEVAEYLAKLEGEIMAIDADMKIGECLPPSVYSDRILAALSRPAHGGWPIVPPEITDDMRYAAWKAQGLHIGATELEAIQMANRHMTPEQRSMDQAAYAAMLGAIPRNDRGSPS